jgi:uncharacterized membrane protein (DUF485 family)
MTSAAPVAHDELSRRRQVRRMAIVLGLIAMAVYACYILFMLRHARA